jgi:cobalamin-dependent methionine synthase I
MIVIGERINASRKTPREAILAHDRATIVGEIRKQDDAGAKYIDLNAGTGEGDASEEIQNLCWLIDVALETTERKLVLDAAAPEILAAAAEHLAGRRPCMLNSIKAEDAIMDRGFAVAAEHDAPLIALAMDEHGIPREPAKRVDICKRITEAAGKHGIPAKRLFFDPLVLPIAADVRQGMVTLETLERIKAVLPEAKTTMGVSNFSHGLKKRAEINRAFLTAALTHGLDSALCDPTRPSIRKGLLLGQLISGRDRHCRRYGQAVREGLFDPSDAKPKEGQTS